jgi:hypothetical protein
MRPRSRAASPSRSSANRPLGPSASASTNEKTAQLAAGRYIDALQLTIGDIVSPLWSGVILVAANPRRALLTT